jgi:hypothetical protein
MRILPSRAPQVPDYYEIVQEAIDLRMIADRIDSGDYYITLEARDASARGVCVCMRGFLTRRCVFVCVFADLCG